MLFSKKNIFFDVPKLIVLFTYFFIPTFICIPWWWLVDIKKVNGTNSYAWAKSEFSNTRNGEIYILALYLMETVFPCLSLLILFGIAKFKFNKIMKSSSSMLAQTPQPL